MDGSGRTGRGRRAVGEVWGMAENAGRGGGGRADPTVRPERFGCEVLSASMYLAHIFVGFLLARKQAVVRICEKLLRSC